MSELEARVIPMIQGMGIFSSILGLMLAFMPGEATNYLSSDTFLILGLGTNIAILIIQSIGNKTEES